MKKLELKRKRSKRRKRIIRKKITGSAKKPRLSVFRSNKYIYIQAIDDDSQKTLACASSLKYKGKLNLEIAGKVGTEMGEILKKNKIESVVFDRNGYLYTGRIKALADGIRKAGIKF